MVPMGPTRFVGDRRSHSSSISATGSLSAALVHIDAVGHEHGSGQGAEIVGAEIVEPASRR